MRIDIITLFPDYFTIPLQTSIVGRAASQGIVQFQIHNLRHWAENSHSTVDDSPYGGGPGMVLKVDVMKRALDAITAKSPPSTPPFTILLTPQGEQLKQGISQKLSLVPWLIFICGHYEGFDERIRRYVDLELRIGPYVLSGGEPAALVAIDSLVRLLPGSTGHRESIIEESFSLQDEHGQPLLEYPQYTRPEVFDGERVPDILLSGNHAAISAWRLTQAKQRTKQKWGET